MQHGRAKRVVVIGAGPIGLAAALGARDRGFDVTVLERDEVGASLRRWGPTRFFTPLRMNFPGVDGDELLTGPEFADRVLVPAAATLDVRTQTRVVSIARRGLTRTDYAGHPLRAERPFRVLTDGDDVLEADVILDATGSTAAPLPYAGRGGERVDAIRTLGALHARREELRGRRVLLVGHGHSAANALAMLRDTEVTWAVRTAKARRARRSPTIRCRSASGWLRRRMKWRRRCASSGGRWWKAWRGTTGTSTSH